MKNNHLDNTRILIVEDSYSFAIELEIQLQSWGHKVVGICDNSAEALFSIQQKNPDLILMDINIIGDYNGLEIGQQIKGFDIPIIYMTGLRDKTIFEEAKNTTGISFLIKPFDMLTLKGAIDFYFKKQSNRHDQKRKNETNDIFIRKNKELIRITPSDVDWISSSGNYCIVSVNNKKYILTKSMKKTISLFPAYKFIQIHKSYYVRLTAVDGVLLSENKVRIKGQLLPLGRNYRKKLIERIKRIV